MIKVEDIDNNQKRVTFTCDIHPDTSLVSEDFSIERAYDKARAWAFVGLQCFCPSCKEHSNVLQSFTRIGGVILRRRRDLDRLQARVTYMREQINAMPSESNVMTLSYDKNTARLERPERIMLDVLIVQLIADANNA